MSLFPSRYPIVQALMNGVCDVNLALAVAEAGAFPSLFLDMVGDDRDAVVDRCHEQLKEYRLSRGDCDVLVNFPLSMIKNRNIMKLLGEHRPSHFEIWGDAKFVGDFCLTESLLADPFSLKGLEFLRSTSKIFVRILTPFVDPIWLSKFDGFCIKGQESGGVKGNWPVSELFAHMKTTHPSGNFIPYGGVSTATQVKTYLQSEAPAVAVGTLIAASRESPLSLAAKEKMVKASSSDIKTTPDTKQNALIFDLKDQSLGPGFNRNDQLKEAIQTGEKGLLYAGKGIDQVKDIVPVKEIIQRLVSELDQVASQ